MSHKLGVTCGIEIPSKRKKNGRSSKLSSALKSQLLTLLKQQKKSVRQISTRLGINYSSAKVIARENKHIFKQKITSCSDFEQEYLPSNFKKIKVQKKQGRQCTFSEIGERILDHHCKSDLFARIEIISTVAWNFLEWGLPSAQNTENGQLQNQPEYRQ